MLDDIIYFILNYSLVVMAVLFLVKAILFIIYKNKNWRLFEFIYFNQVNIKYTSTSERARAKRLQNTLSFIILVFLILKLLTSILFYL